VNSEDVITIRPLTISDDENIYAAVRESMIDLLPWMPWCHQDYCITETRAWVEFQISAFQEGNDYQFAIFSQNGLFLGMCGLNQIDKVNRRANLGYWIRSNAKSRGFATAAVHLLRDWGFQNTNLVRMEIVIASDNGASLRVAEKSGACREGIAYRRIFLDNTPKDAIIFSFIRP
jgi:RimJ/RimL family protein N-acetyltransferase